MPSATPDMRILLRIQRQVTERFVRALMTTWSFIRTHWDEFAH